jgi:2-iminobutanoate/2-iminopropanoate deaminase
MKAVGPKISFPISPAVVAGNLFYATSLPVDLQTGHFVGGPIDTQTKQVLSNLDSLLKDVGGSMSDVAQITFYLVDSKDVVGMNKVYAEFFTKAPYPSRATVVVHELIGPPGILIEAAAQAYLLSS